MLALSNPGLARRCPSRPRRCGGRSIISAFGLERSCASTQRRPRSGSCSRAAGVWTTVDGDACHMHPGDLVLTPCMDVPRPHQRRRRAHDLVRRARPADHRRVRRQLLREPSRSEPAREGFRPVIVDVRRPGVVCLTARRTIHPIRRCSSSGGSTVRRFSTSFSRALAARWRASSSSTRPPVGLRSREMGSPVPHRVVPGRRTPIAAKDGQFDLRRASRHGAERDRWAGVLRVPGRHVRGAVVGGARPRSRNNGRHLRSQR